jgi:hypothetical protein
MRLRSEAGMKLKLEVKGYRKWVRVRDLVKGEVILNRFVLDKPRPDSDESAQPPDDSETINLDVSTRDGVGDVTVEVGRAEDALDRRFRSRDIEGTCGLIVTDSKAKRSTNVGCTWEETA